MRLEQFQYVVEIARCKSMSKASKKLYITQPSLSMAIQNLESELGFQIFKRSFQGVALTEKGEEFLKISNIMVQQLERVKSLSESEAPLNATVNIAAVPAACSSLIIDLVNVLRQQESGITINIQERRPTKILASLIDNTADIGIGTYVPSTREQILKEATSHDIHIETVFEDNMCAYLHRNHPLAHRSSVSMEELEHDTPILFNDFVKMDALDTAPPFHQETHNYFSFSDQSCIKKAVAKGLGYAVLPHQSAVDDIYVTSGMVFAVPISDGQPTLTTFLAYCNQFILPSAEQRALLLLRTEYSLLQAQQKQIAGNLQKSSEKGASGCHLYY